MYFLGGDVWRDKLLYFCIFLFVAPYLHRLPRHSQGTLKEFWCFKMYHYHIKTVQFKNLCCYVSSLHHVIGLGTYLYRVS